MAVLTPRVAVRNGSVNLGVATTSTGLAPTSTDWRVNLGQVHIQAHTVSATATRSTVSSGFCDTLIPRDEKIGFLVSWYASATGETATLSVAQGSAGRAWQRGLGQFNVTLTCTVAGGAGYQHFLGPFESARFAYDSTSEDDAIRMWISSATSNLDASYATVEAFRMPQVTYAT